MRSSSMAGGGRRSTTPLIAEARQMLLEAPRNEPWFGYWAAQGSSRRGVVITRLARVGLRDISMEKALAPGGGARFCTRQGPACALMEARAVEVEAAAVGV